MIKIRSKYYKILISKSINYFNDEQNTVKCFFDFLEVTDMLTIHHYETKEEYDSSIKISFDKKVVFNNFDIADYSYDNLYNKLKDFIILLTNEEVENPIIHAKYLLNYFKIIFYRANMKILYKSDLNDIFSYGMSVTNAHDYFYGSTVGTDNKYNVGIIEYFRKFCVKHKLPDFLEQSLKSNESFETLFYGLQNLSIDEARDYVSNMTDATFSSFYKGFLNINNFVDYRLYCCIALKLLMEIEKANITINTRTNKKEDFKQVLINKSKKFILEMIKEIPTLNKMSNQTNFMSFNDFYEYERALDCIILSTTQFDLLNISVDCKSCISYVNDLKYLNNKELFISLTTNYYKELLNDGVCDDSNELSYNSLKVIFDNEFNKRQLLFNEKIKVESNEIKDKDEYVRDFFRHANSANAPDDCQQLVVDDSIIDVLLEKIKADNESYNIIAGYENRFQKTKVGYSIDDYTFLICGPIKRIEMFIKRALIHNYPGKCKKCWKVQGQWVSSNNDLISSEEDIFRITLCESIISLQNAMLLSHIDFPWFLKDNDMNDSLSQECKLYTKFASHVRNGYFHMDIIAEYDQGKSLYYEVSYWFVVCLLYFNIS